MTVTNGRSSFLLGHTTHLKAVLAQDTCTVSVSDSVFKPRDQFEPMNEEKNYRVKFHGTGLSHNWMQFPVLSRELSYASVPFSIVESKCSN